MKSLFRSFAILTFSSAVAQPLWAQDSENAKTNDLINFKNDDLLHGRFLGFTTSGKIIWKNDSAENNIAFETAEVRKIVKNNGQITKPFSHSSFVTLKSHDTIPGKIVSMKDESLILETDYSGEIVIPRELITNIEFNPHGSQIIYRGPFTEDEQWKLKYSAQYQPNEEDEEDTKKPDAWLLKNFSLQHNGTPSSFIMQEDLPEQFRITFGCYTTQSYYPSIVILADLNVPEFDKEDSALTQNRNRYKSTVGGYLGSCVVIKPHTSGSSLTHYGYKEDGTIYQNNVTNSIRAASNRSTHVKKFYDLRVDTNKGLVMLYIDKKHVGQWQIDDIVTKLTGNNLGFSMQYSNSKAKTVISNIVISKWNGVKDSALSLESDARDIVMLNNGTDRYSGKVTAINQTTVELNTNYAELSIPNEQVNSINLATPETDELQPRNVEDTTIRFYGTGKLTGKVSKAEDGYITLDSETLGLIKIKTEYISSFEFINMDHAYEIYN